MLGTPWISVANQVVGGMVYMIDPVIVSRRKWRALSQRRAYQQQIRVTAKRSSKRELGALAGESGLPEHLIDCGIAVIASGVRSTSHCRDLRVIES